MDRRRALTSLIAPVTQDPDIRIQVVTGTLFLEVIRMVLSQSFDLVVMGTIARTGVSGLFIGNTAEAVFHQLQCSILAVKPPGFESPVKPG
ncbi:MAG: universal stress protein [Desulfotignum sp.]